MDFPGGFGDKELACQCRRHRRHGLDPWVGKIPWRRAGQPTPVFLPGESHGQRGLVSYSPWGHKESDTTERLSTAKGVNFSLSGCGAHLARAGHKSLAGPSFPLEVSSFFLGAEWLAWSLNESGSLTLWLSVSPFVKEGTLAWKVLCAGVRQGMCPQGGCTWRACVCACACV